MSRNGKRSREDQEVHQLNMQRREDDDRRAPETLKYIADPSEEVEPPVDGLDWVSSKSTSTSNLKEEDVRSREWVIEFMQLLSRLERPTTDGLSGHLRAYAFDDPEETDQPLSPSEKLRIEGAGEVGKEASTRARDGWATETATADTKESIVQTKDDEDGNTRGGLLSSMRGR